MSRHYRLWNLVALNEILQRFQRLEIGPMTQAFYLIRSTTAGQWYAMINMPMRAVIIPSHSRLKLPLQMLTQEIWSAADNLEGRSATSLLASEIRTDRAANRILQSKHWI